MQTQEARTLGPWTQRASAPSETHSPTTITECNWQVERIGALESQHAKLLAGLPEESQRHYWSRHQEACDGQGKCALRIEVRKGRPPCVFEDSGALHAGADRWVFPPPIYDEEEYRRRVKAEEAAAAAAAETGAAAAGGQLG